MVGIARVFTLRLGGQETRADFTLLSCTCQSDERPIKYLAQTPKLPVFAREAVPVHAGQGREYVGSDASQSAHSYSFYTRGTRPALLRQQAASGTGGEQHSGDDCDRSVCDGDWQTDGLFHLLIPADLFMLGRHGPVMSCQSLKNDSAPASCIYAVVVVTGVANTWAAC
ncbi:hypothetical protein P154DRAFT_572128 [Amniculicola lignicola CBS 123094]|uniref:Uncharacterized protein n=1 Tax=Amniculicola lignicola CBS 123094 TaxID=1392246 RepID=A0A6A5WTQ6_9PLEO|nr:hypothetical protein P154DRAFT_572128 [Amniculicola lignicola CBS 123094]